MKGRLDRGGVQDLPRVLARPRLRRRFSSRVINSINATHAAAIPMVVDGLRTTSGGSQARHDGVRRHTAARAAGRLPCTIIRRAATTSSWRTSRYSDDGRTRRLLVDLYQVRGAGDLHRRGRPSSECRGSYHDCQEFLRMRLSSAWKSSVVLVVALACGACDKGPVSPSPGSVSATDTSGAHRADGC